MKTQEVGRKCACAGTPEVQALVGTGKQECGVRGLGCCSMGSLERDFTWLAVQLDTQVRPSPPR